MLLIEELNHKNFELCFELDSNTISLWSKKQWENEFNKNEVKVFGLFFYDRLVGICVIQVVIDEAHINYFAINKKFHRQGFGTFLMNYLINHCDLLSIKKLLLEVSQDNISAEGFYSRFDFSTIGIRKNYYKDGSSALLKEKNLIKK
tara:strand:- start:97 stop:537 length:441 start_codon:yes stop_codon:yes gene_type:complete